MERRKLFSESAPVVRRKLFCGVSPEPAKVRILTCADCGKKFETTETAEKTYCPCCGGKRFIGESEVVGRRELFDESKFQKEFSETTDNTELMLKQFSGQEISLEEYERQFSELPIDEFESFGYGHEENGTVKVFSSAFEDSRLFSCIRMTITKTLELDPAICDKPLCPEEKIAVIKKIEDKLQPKTVMLLKKAHGLPLEEDHENWMKDSGICNDLGIEFGGSKKDLPEFKETINERYPDAPENIMDLLVKRGIIKVDGGQVEINK